jgi:hypothetical protein
MAQTNGTESPAIKLSEEVRRSRSVPFCSLALFTLNRCGLARRSLNGGLFGVMFMALAAFAQIPDVDLGTPARVTHQPAPMHVAAKADSMSPALSLPDTLAQSARTPVKLSPRIHLDANGALVEGGAFTMRVDGGIVEPIEISGPTGQRLRLRAAAIGASDPKTGHRVWLATLREDCLGVVLAGQPVRIAWTNAFVGLAADVVLQYNVNSVIHDVFLREPIDFPEVSGLDPETARLELWSEVFDAPPTRVTTRTISLAAEPGAGSIVPLSQWLMVEDQELSWTGMKMIPGKAFRVNDLEAAPPENWPVGRSWRIDSEQRAFIVETVAYKALQSSWKRVRTAGLSPRDLSVSDPAQAAIQAALQGQPVRRSHPWLTATGKSALPPSLTPSRVPTTLAQLTPSQTMAWDRLPGLELDWTLVNDVLVNVNWGETGGKTGPAAVGKENSDYWNFCPPPDSSDLTIRDLKLSDQTPSSVSLRVQKVSGVGRNAMGDPLFDGYAYGRDGEMILTVSGLPAGYYHFYLYSHGNADGQDGVFTLNGVVKSSAQAGGRWKSPLAADGFIENENYARFASVSTSVDAPVTITVGHRGAGDAIINGLQIAAATNEAPEAVAGSYPPVVMNGSKAIVNLVGAAVDDGLPAGAPLNLAWSQSGGPSPVVFSPATGMGSRLASTATFDEPGSYQLRLVASDGQLSDTNEVTLEVEGQSSSNMARSTRPRTGMLARSFDTVKDGDQSIFRDDDHSLDYVVYCSSTNLNKGDGSQKNPFKSISSIAWGKAAQAATNGAQARVWLQCGSVFTEAVSITGSGCAGNPIVIGSYPGPSEERPLIQGVLAPLDNWTLNRNGPGRTWQAESTAASLACTNGVPLVRGTGGPAALGHGQWCYDSQKVYYRNDLGSPADLGATFQVAQTPSVLTLTDRRFVTLNNLQLKYGNSMTLWLNASATGCSDITLSNCVVSVGGYLTDFDSVSNLVCRNCVFSRGMASGGNLYFEGSKRPCSWEFYYCLISDYSGNARGGLTGVGAHTGKFINCDFISCVNEHFCNSGKGVVGFTNCLFTGSTAGNTRYNPVLVNSGSGSLCLSDCLVLGNGKSITTNAFFHNCSLVGPIYYEDPQFRSTRMPGFLAFTTDDCVNSGDWLDLCANYANPRKIPMGLALDMLNIGEADTNGIQRQLLLGHELMNHTKTHSSVTNKHGFTIRAMQTGVDKATLTVSNNAWLYIKTNGVTLAFDLTSETNRNMHRLTLNLAAKGFMAATYTYGQEMSCANLSNVVSANIMKSFAVPLDYQRYLMDEIFSQQTNISRYFTNAAGQPYVPRTMAYPYGQTDSQVITNLTNLFIGCRSTVNNMQYMPQGVNLYNMYVLSPFAISSLLLLETNLNSAASGGGWKAGRMTYDSGVKKRGGFSAVFDGVSCYATNTASSYSDFSGGDWQICAWVKPVLDGRSTLYSQYTDVDNQMAIYWDQRGAVHLRVLAEGAEVMDLATPEGVLDGAGWQRLRVEELFDEWTIRVDGVLRARLTNALRLPFYTGGQYLGCAPVRGRQRANYAHGWVDNFHIANGTYRRMLSLCDQLCDQGEVGAILSHGQDNVPNEVFDLIFRAVRDYSGDLRVMPYSQMVSWLRANGSVVNHTNVFVAPFANQDYHLRPTSPALRSGNASVIPPNAMDITGQVVSSGSRPVETGEVSIGCYQRVAQRKPKISPGADVSRVGAAADAGK